MPESIHVVHVVWSLHIGGTEILLLNLIRRMDHRRYMHDVICLGPDGPMRRHFEDSGICPVVLQKINRLDNFRAVWVAASELRRRNPDVVHIHRNGRDVWGQLAALAGNCGNVVVTEHAPYGLYGGPVGLFARRLLRRQVDMHVAISAAVKEDLLGYRLAEPSDVMIIPNGVDIDNFMPAPDPVLSRDRIVIGSVGKLAEHKGHEDLLAAFRILRDQGLRARLVIAGIGPLAEHLREQAGDLGLAECVEFVGAVADMPRFYQQIDLFALPSRIEGFGLALAEAMSCALPVVASRIQGITDLVENGQTGLLTPASDPGALASALRRILDDPEMGRQLGRRARERIISHFSIDRMVTGYARLYDKVIESGGPR